MAETRICNCGHLKSIHTKDGKCLGGNRVYIPGIGICIKPCTCGDKK